MVPSQSTAPKRAPPSRRPAISGARRSSAPWSRCGTARTARSRSRRAAVPPPARKREHPLLRQVAVHMDDTIAGAAATVIGHHRHARVACGGDQPSDRHVERAVHTADRVGVRTRRPAWRRAIVEAPEVVRDRVRLPEHDHQRPPTAHDAAIAPPGPCGARRRRAAWPKPARASRGPVRISWKSANGRRPIARRISSWNAGG